MGRKGFTLIELLVVIAIIAVVVSIVIVAIDPVQRLRDAQDRRAASNVQVTGSVVGACVTYKLAQRPLPSYEECALPGTIDGFGNVPSTVRIEAGAAGGDNDVCVAEQGSLGIGGRYYVYTYSGGVVTGAGGDLATEAVSDWCP